MSARRIGYVRVSSLTQNTERQLEGVQVDKVFTEKVSGKDLHRPELHKAMAALLTGDTLVVHSLDRLARNAEDLLRIVRELTEKGITVEFVKNKLVFRPDEQDHMAKLMLTMLAGFAAFERDIIRERQMEGIAIAKRIKGKYKGRAKSLGADEVQRLRDRADKGATKVDLAKEFKVSRTTVYEYLTAK